MSKADKLLKRVEFYEKMAQSQKPETNELLNKASLFERLALYSDRKSFLTAIAQSNPGDIGQTENYIRNTVSSIVNSVQNWIGTHSERQAHLPNNLPGLPPALDAAYKVVLSFNSLGAKFDVTELPRLLQAAKSLAYVGNLGNMGDDAKKAWLSDVFPKVSQLMTQVQKQIDDLAAFKRDFGPEAPSEVASETIELDDVKPTPAAQQRRYPAISTADQQAILKFVQDENLGTLDAAKLNDGSLGPETRKGLELVKDYFQKTYPNNPRMSDAQAITAAKAPKR